MGHVRQIEQADGIRVRDYVSWERLPGAIGIVGPGRIVDGEAHVREVPGPFGAGRDGVSEVPLELLLRRMLVVPEEKELIFLDRSPNRAALLVTMEVRWSVGLAL